MAIVAECSRCEQPVTVEELPTDAAKVSYVASQLIGHVFVFDTLVHHEAFEHLLPEYEQRVGRMVHVMSEWVHDLQDWHDSTVEGMSDGEEEED